MILRATVGSVVHGLSNPGTDDRDELGVCVEPPEYLLGFRRFEHSVYRSQPEGEPSGPGDLDLVVYGLRRYCHLALKGSPTALLPLFVKGEHVLLRTELGAELQSISGAFLGRSTGRAFIGYLDAQRNGLVDGTNGSRTREQSSTHGYDTKYAMHALRIGHQGIELLRTGRITLPIAEPLRSELMEVRRGEPPLAEVLERIDRVTEDLGRVRTESHLADHPDTDAVDEFLALTYRRAWDAGLHA